MTEIPSGADAKLVYMANQIATFFATQAHDEAVSGIENHIRKFWDPRMRAKIVSLAGAAGSGLDPLAQAAVQRLSV
jgi:formate dehydrogenase subunit delta